MTVKEHYDKHLGNFYSWFTGDFRTKVEEFQEFLTENGIKPEQSKMALDLGAGHGIQSVAMAKNGFNVTAIDFNKQLLSELSTNSKSYPIDIIKDNICNVKNYVKREPELIICYGDTLMHLENKNTIKNFINDCAETLTDNGKLILSFRNYTEELKGENRFIPVKSDNDKILTCVLEYYTDKITVTDLLQERSEQGWVQKISSYNKVRILPKEIEDIIKKCGLKITVNKIINRLEIIIAEK